MREKKKSSSIDFLTGMLLFGFLLMVFEPRKKKERKRFWPFS